MVAPVRQLDVEVHRVLITIIGVATTHSAVLREVIALRPAIGKEMIVDVIEVRAEKSHVKEERGVTVLQNQESAKIGREKEKIEKRRE
jgi:hypothetical protein